MDKEVLDITDIKSEFEKLNRRFSTLEKRFIAVALDYTHFIDGSWDQDEIYQLRDDTIHRLFSSKLHIEILIRQNSLIHHRIQQKLKDDPSFFQRRYVTSNPLYDHFGKEMSGIFDSVLFHAVATFDYLSNLCSYICSKNRNTKLKWNGLLRSIRDPKNQLYNSKIAPTILEIDKEFVDKLYNLRSNIIHEKVDRGKYHVTMEWTPEELNISQSFFIGENLIRKFSELKEINKTKSITVLYAAFWILNLCIDKITDILFSLKSHMESNPEEGIPSIGLLTDENNLVSPSAQYWEEQEYLNSRK